MRLSIAGLALLIVVDQVSAAQAGLSVSWEHVVDVLRSRRSESHIEARSQQDAHTVVHRSLLRQRDVSPSSATITPSAKASAVPTSAAIDDPGSWDRTTEAACLKGFHDHGDTTSSPSGIAACYNIKYFDDTTGVFQADLRLYRISPATGDWAKIRSDGVSIKLSCKGASIATGKMQMGKRDDRSETWSQVQKLRVFRRSTPSSPKMLQQMDFYGEIREDLMKPNQTEDAIRSLLAPTIAFSGTSANGTSLMTDLSNSGTSFVNGAFASASSGSSAGAKTSAEHGFLMPGRTLGIFPVGLIITSTWTALFLLTVGVGTVDRIRFREAYRRRMKRELSLRVRTI